MTTALRFRNRLRDQLNRNERVFGIWLTLFSPAVAEIMGLAGFPVLLVDMEHGPGDIEALAEMLRAAEATDSSVMVRLPRSNTETITRLLDLGPAGVMMPMVSSAEEARLAVAACRYPPDGTRGWGASASRAARYGFDSDYTLTTARDLVVAVQIETVRAVHAIESILAVPGIDIIFVGVNDLAADAGHILDVDHPEVRQLVDHVQKRAAHAKIKIGTVPTPKRNYASLYGDGFDMVLPVGDIGLLREAAAREMAAFEASRG